MTYYAVSNTLDLGALLRDAGVLRGSTDVLRSDPVTRSDRTDDLCDAAASSCADSDGDGDIDSDVDVVDSDGDHCESELYEYYDYYDDYYEAHGVELRDDAYADDRALWLADQFDYTHHAHHRQWKGKSP
eukprot:CAMPEP_0198345452 /NCGR_PEP_ID=MMETSP1450-20131203/74157_1 /TAXON_ID=753684 ORGANISM="Madagascaria erythrocladiodes, Strain CCMP3234" /NCGR_SAMPLE_ID=MMETSP1450 /ASSEMBLY_ACC=CAM_ASM_001115 /LENGTH=129 /DNA_ID=CAMNT_0044050801 /DNA_START=102 /DNA_END=487 /DNA_ORIENTATION=-